MSRCVLAALVLCAFAGPAAAQGLGDAARKESERRSRARGSSKDAGRAGAKVYTADDLRHGGATAASQPSPAATPRSGDDTSTWTTLQDPPPADAGESGWRNRAATLRQNVTRLEREVEEADRAATRAAYDGPMDRYGYVNTEHARWVARAEQARAALARARKALEDFEEEARRAGVPPGWLR